MAILDERRCYKRFDLDQAAQCGLPDGTVHEFRLSNISYGGTYLRYADEKSDRWKIARSGVHPGEAVVLSFEMAIGRKKLPEKLICRVLSVTSQGLRLGFVTQPNAGLGALRSLCDRHAEVKLSTSYDKSARRSWSRKLSNKAVFLVD